MGLSETHSKKELKKVRREARKHLSDHAMFAAKDLESMIVKLPLMARLSVAWKISKGDKFLTQNVNGDSKRTS